MSVYRRRPNVVEAYRTCGGDFQEEAPSWIFDAIHHGVITIDHDGLHIRTLEGVMDVGAGDWIVRGIKGELYPVKPMIFEALYEKVEG